MIYVYKYSLIWYCEIDEKNVLESGITFANTYHEAVTNLEKQYGNEIICINELEECDFGTNYTLTSDELEELGYMRKVGNPFD